MTSTVLEPEAGQIIDGTHILPIRVYFEDTDAEGIVYYANYLKFFERGRTESFRAAGVELRDLIEQGDGVMFVIRRCEIDYLTPARLSDAINILSVVTEMKGASFTMEQSAMRGETELCKVVVRIGTINRAGKPTRIPLSVRETVTAALTRS